MSQNAKGELAFRVKVYEGTTQEGMDDIGTIATETLARLTRGTYGTIGQGS